MYTHPEMMMGLVMFGIMFVVIVAVLFHAVMEDIE